MHGAQTEQFGEVPQRDAEDVFQQFKKGAIDILDVREAGEWQLGHIEGAAWIPLGQLPRRRQEIKPGRKLVVVCLSGSRSDYAASLLRQTGIDAENLEGGMLAWQAAHLPITPPGIIAPH